VGIETLCDSGAVQKHYTSELVHLGGDRSSGPGLGFVQ